MSAKRTIVGQVALGCLLVAGVAGADVPATPSPAASAERNPEALVAEGAATPVRFRDRVLFEINSSIGTLTPAQRAQAIEKRLLAVAGGPATVLGALRIAENNGLSEIFAGDTLIRAVTDQDVQSTGRTRRQVAADQLLVINEALKIEFRDRGAAHILRSLGFAAAATVVLLVLLVGLRWAYRWTHARITQAAQAWHWKSGLARLKLLSPVTVANASRSAASALAWGSGLLLFYFYLEFVLSLLPWTRGLSDQMVITTRRAIMHVFSGLFDYVPSLISIIVIVLVARFILKALKGLFEQIASGNLPISGFYADWSAPTYALVRFLVIAIAAVMVFPYLPGSGSAGFQGVATFVGLALSFGGAPAIANIIAGVILTYMRPFGIGDRVKIADAVGDIVDKSLLVVRLTTIKNVEISIPNSLVLANHIVNFSKNAKESGLILHTTITIGYDAPWKQVHDLLITAAKRVEGVLVQPAPFVLQTSLDDFYVAYEINAYTDRPNEQAGLYSSLHAEIQNAFNEGGIEILSPHYAAVRDGSTMAVPTDYLPKDYKAPGFTLLSHIMRPTQGT